MSETALTVAGDEGLAVTTPPAEKYVHGFEGMAEGAFDEKAIAVLKEPVDPRLVEVKPDGIVYLPWTWYADRLNRAFGQGAWTIVPRDKAQIMGSHVIYFGALYVQKRFIREAAGECEYRANNPNMSYAACFEGAFSDCIVRCCKILGIGKELWDPTWREAWLAEWALKAWAKKKDPGDKPKPYYWRKDRERPWQVEGAATPARNPPPGAPRLPEVPQLPKAPALSVVAESPPSASGAVPSESAAPSTEKSAGEPSERVPGSDDVDDTETGEVDAELVECFKLFEEGNRKNHTYKCEWVPAGKRTRRTEQQAAKMVEGLELMGITPEDHKGSLSNLFGKETIDDLSVDEADDYLNHLRSRWNKRKYKHPRDKAAAKDQRSTEVPEEMREWMQGAPMPGEPTP